MSSSRFTTAVVVTYNRRALLERCLAALAAQSHAPDRILLIDNASTDGTADAAEIWAGSDPARHRIVRMSSNTGGAGGFARGIAEGLADGGWLWLMDDDAEPDIDALGELLKVANQRSDVYGSLAYHGEATSWTTTLRLPGGDVAVDRVADVPDVSEVNFLPFLGFMIHADLVNRIGLPDAGYFIAGDDAEYCLRARAVGARIHVVPTSLISHPPSVRGQATWLGITVAYLSLPAWKRYYDTRNRILTAKRHAGVRGWLAVTGSTVWRLALAVSREQDPAAQARATIGGLIDGSLGRRGARHGRWGVGV